MIMDIKKSIFATSIASSLLNFWYIYIKSQTSTTFGQIREGNNDPLVKEFINLYHNFNQQRETDKFIIRSIPVKDEYLAPKYPIVLCHGLSGFDKLILIPSINQLVRLISHNINFSNSESLLEDYDDHSNNINKNLLEINYWTGIKTLLESKGCQVIIAKVPSFGCIEERANVLNEFIETEINKLQGFRLKNDMYTMLQVQDKQSNRNDLPKVNLIAHSMGGIDCRYLISKKLNKSFDIVSLTTISTPHHGSEMADYVVQLFCDIRSELPLNKHKKLLPPAFYQLTTYYMKYFNAVTPDDPHVSYFSYGAYFKPKWYNLFYTSWKTVSTLSDNSMNDGMVTVKSSKWGKYMGTLWNMDHLDVINWKSILFKDFLTLDLIGSKISQSENTEVDVLQFYLMITDNLARMGF